MGMFDSVWIECPICKESVEEQSKASDCRLIDYSIHTAPPEVLLDIGNKTLYCKNRHAFYVHVQIITHAEIVKGYAPEHKYV